MDHTGAAAGSPTVVDDPALPRLHGEGVLLHGRFAEAEGAPLAVVLHGGPGGDHRSLLALEALSDTYRVLFYDQRGAGLSERVTEARLGMADHLADLDALITAHGGGPVLLIGHFWARCWPRLTSAIAPRWSQTFRCRSNESPLSPVSRR